MKTEFGLQVDAWGALVMGKGHLAKEIEGQVIRELKSKEIAGLKMTRGKVGLDSPSHKGQEHLIIRQDLGDSGEATVLLRIGRRAGEDLEIAWRLFERDKQTEAIWGLSQSALVILGVSMIIAGLISLVFGYGLCLIPAGVFLTGTGLGWWRIGQRRTTATTEQQFESRALIRTVDYHLMRALASRSIGHGELRVLRQADIAGMGNLEKTSPIDLV